MSCCILRSKAYPYGSPDFKTINERSSSPDRKTHNEYSFLTTSVETDWVSKFAGNIIFFLDFWSRLFFCFQRNYV